jgi:hypothetical protein
MLNGLWTNDDTQSEPALLFPLQNNICSTISLSNVA